LEELEQDLQMGSAMRQVYFPWDIWKLVYSLHCFREEKLAYSL
jgi:hypothetical protein